MRSISSKGLAKGERVDHHSGGYCECTGPPQAAPARDRSPTMGDASIPTPLLTAPAPTRAKLLPSGFLLKIYPCKDRKGPHSAPHLPRPYGTSWAFIVQAIRYAWG